MCVPTVAGVDHMHVRLPVLIEMRRDQVRRARLRVAHDKHVSVHRDQVVHRVEQRFALRRRRHADVEIDHVRGEPLGGNLERSARARRVFEEQVEYRLATQQRHLLHFPFGDRSERLGGVENMADHVGREAFERQQMRELAIGVELGIANHALVTGSTVNDNRPLSRDNTIDKSRATASRAPT